MSLNDMDIISQTGKATNIYPGVANPTSKSGTTDPITSNFVDDPTTPSVGAGAGPNFEGHRQAERMLNKTAGVVEARPGIIESTNIDPLNENSNKDDGWANASSRTTNKVTESAASGKGYVSKATEVVTGGAKIAYGHLAGDEQAKREGSEVVFGK